MRSALLLPGGALQITTENIQEMTQDKAGSSADSQSAASHGQQASEAGGVKL